MQLAFPCSMSIRLLMTDPSCLIYPRFTVHLDGYHLLVNNTIRNRLGDEVQQLSSVSQETPIGCVPNFSPICVIGSSEMSNHIIYTASEFEKMQFLKIKVSTAFSCTLTGIIVQALIKNISCSFQGLCYCQYKQLKSFLQ